MDITDANNFPVYIRVQSKSNRWDIMSATVETVPLRSIFSIKYPKVVVGDHFRRDNRISLIDFMALLS